MRRMVLAALLAVHAGLLAWSSFCNSVTFDEYAHLPAGASYLRYRKFDVYDFSPPLLRVIGAWPAIAVGADVPDVAPFLARDTFTRHWDYADAFAAANRANYHRLFVLGRMGMIPVSCAGLWLTYWWSSKLYGSVAALVSAALWAFCPNILAHGSIVGTDVGTTVAMMAAAFFWWRFCQRTTWTRFAPAAATVVLAMLCKFTALLLWPGMIVIAWMTVARNRDAWGRIAIGWLASAALCLLAINVAYGFEASGMRIGDLHFRSTEMSRLQRILPMGFRMPLPLPMIEGLDAQNWEMDQGGPGFLLDQRYQGAKWYYYPVALACKLPLATLALVAWTVMSFFGWTAPFRPKVAGEAVPIVLAGLYLAVAMFAGRTNLGIRYVLPMLPLMFVVVGRLWPNDLASARGIAIAVIALVAVVAVESVSVAPRFLTFFNVACGRARGGYTILNDSNLDWGQGLLELREWMAENNVPRVQFAYFGRVEPSIYEINYVPITQPDDDRYVAISSYFLVGLWHHMPTRTGPTNALWISSFRELRAKPPAAVVAESIYIFERRDVDAAMREHARGHE